MSHPPPEADPLDGDAAPLPVAATHVAAHAAAADPPGWCLTLPSLRDEAWRRLVRGAVDRRSGFHTMTVATVRPDGTPTARTVVLRAVDPVRRTLRFHTDRRSGKLTDLAAEPQVCLLLYDAGAKLQIRLHGPAQVLAEGDLPDRAWQATRPMSRACYRQPAAPGAPVPEPCAAIPDEAGDLHGRENFTAVEVQVTRMDVLYLHVRGHRRAGFVWEAAGGEVGDGVRETAAWLAP